MEIRVGTGFDVHRFEKGRKLILGGVEIPSEVGLAGHSDADVMLHAVSDALLGAAGLGDIGRHFPDTDDAYKDISSMIILRECAAKIAAEGFHAANVDVTLIAEKPKISRFADEMRRNIAEALRTPIEMINIKGTTTEGLGFTGRGEGIACMAVCTIVKTGE